MNLKKTRPTPHIISPHPPGLVFFPPIFSPQPSNPSTLYCSSSPSEDSSPES